VEKEWEGLASPITTHKQQRKGGGREIAQGRKEVEGEEVLIEGSLRELRLRVQERRPAAASPTALQEGLLR
jgi:hypothetical protein